MPIKNVLKSYKPETYYHLYNLGIEDRLLFQEEADYQNFIDFLATSLTPPKTKEELKQEVTIKGTTFKGAPRQPINLHGQLELHAYSLSPTNFHLLVKQKQAQGIETFMRSLGTRYVMYFNKKYHRKGPLFQGTYKAIDIQNEALLLHLSRFLHQKIINTLGISSNHSSYPAYANTQSLPYVITKDITAMLDRDGFLKSLAPTYQNFVEIFNEDSAKILGNLTLES